MRSHSGTRLVASINFYTTGALFLRATNSFIIFKPTGSVLVGENKTKQNNNNNNNNKQAREFIKELGKRITTVTGEIKETSYIFQKVSVAIQRGNMLSFIGSFTTDTD